MAQKKKSPRIYMDVTQLVHWSGRITGIPRVMLELAIRLQKEQPDTVFVSWVKEVGEVCEVNLDASLEGKGPNYVRRNQAEGVATAPAAKSTLIHYAKRVVKAGLKRGARMSPMLAQKMESRLIAAHLQNVKRADMQPGDVVFVPWGEWWDPNFTACLLRHKKAGIKLVQIIHDVGPTVWPQFFEQVKVTPESYNSQIVPAADLVLAVSNNTKKELIQWLKEQKLHVPKVEVFRLGDELKVAKPLKPKEPRFAESRLKGQDFLMAVGTIEAKKNHMLFYYVYKLAAKRGIELPKLVIVGRRGWLTEQAYALMTLDPEVKDKFVFLHNVSDEELSWLYDHCLFTVLASFHEGWGIPIAESLGRGVPCISSNTSSMVEIAEGLVEHFSPSSPDECLALMQKLLKPKELEAARTLVKKYKNHTWDASAEQVMKMMKEL